MKQVQGGKHTDDRGTLHYFNEFDMSAIKRFYRIDHPDTKVVRAWQGHKIEQKWIYCAKGSFNVELIKIENWDNPRLDENIESYILQASNPVLLHIPGGYVNGFSALEEDSSLIVFSDKTLEESGEDDYRFPHMM